MAQSCANCYYVRSRVIERQVNRGTEKRSSIICAHQSPSTGDPRAAWPEVLADDWCGEWAVDNTAVSGQVGRWTFSESPPSGGVDGDIWMYFYLGTWAISQKINGAWIGQGSWAGEGQIVGGAG